MVWVIPALFVIASSCTWAGAEQAWNNFYPQQAAPEQQEKPAYHTNGKTLPDFKTISADVCARWHLREVTQTNAPGNLLL